MTSLDFVKELVNAFNVSNYGSKVNTNFVVEGDNIVVKFNCGQRSAKRYLSQMARDLVREYYSDESVAGHFFDLKSFPFNFDKGRWTFNKAGTQFTVPIGSGVIFNLKVHFAEEFRSEVRHQMIREIGGNSQHIKEILNKNIQQVAMDTSPHYIKCLWFNNPGIQAHFMKVLRAKMQKYSFDLLDFCCIDGNKVYFTNVENIDLVRSVTEVAKKRSGYHFRFPSRNDLKVRKYKGAMGALIFSLTGIPVYGYYRDNFIDEDRISNGDHFAFIPITKEGNNLRYLARMEADKINAKFSHDILTNVRGQTEATRSNEFGEVYALSDRQIALLIPVIIENSVINKDGQIEIDPELRFRALSRSPSTELSDMELESPTCSQGGVKDSPRQGSEREEETEPFLGVLEIDPSQSTCSLRAWDSSTFLNLEVSNEESEKQQVTDKSDRKSSDEYSEAKSQDSKSPKKHGGGFFCKEGPLAKLSSFKRHDEGRDTTRSTPETPVTEKLPVSESSSSFPGRIKAKSNPPSGVTSPTHEGGPEWQQRLDPDQREELCKVLSPEMKEKLNSGFFLPEYEKLLHLLYVDSETLRSLLSTSEGAEQVCSVLPPEKGKQLHPDLPFKAKKGLLFKFFDDEQEISRNVSTSSADSGLGKSLERGQSPSLIEKFNDKSLINSRVDSPNIKKYLQEGKEVFV
ncbi:hypothetical protein LBW99_04195 [Wolbachia endosymbiont of Nasonia oneida]